MPRPYVRKPQGKPTFHLYFASEELYEAAKASAAADSRSLSDWINVQLAKRLKLTLPEKSRATPK